MTNANFWSRARYSFFPPILGLSQPSRFPYLLLHSWFQDILLALDSNCVFNCRTFHCQSIRLCLSRIVASRIISHLWRTALFPTCVLFCSIATSIIASQHTLRIDLLVENEPKDGVFTVTFGDTNLAYEGNSIAGACIVLSPPLTTCQMHAFAGWKRAVGGAEMTI
jgi:hypothetical protein